MDAVLRRDATARPGSGAERGQLRRRSLLTLQLEIVTTHKENQDPADPGVGKSWAIFCSETSTGEHYGAFVVPRRDVDDCANAVFLRCNPYS